MKRSQQLNILAALFLLAGVLLALGWFIVSLSVGGALTMNGPWLIAVLACLIGAAFGFASVVAGRQEWDQARARAMELAE